MQTTYKRRMRRQVGDTHHRASARKAPLPELAPSMDALATARRQRAPLLEPKSTSTNDPTQDNNAVDQADDTKES